MDIGVVYQTDLFLNLFLLNITMSTKLAHWAFNKNILLKMFHCLNVIAKILISLHAKNTMQIYHF